MTIQVKAIEQYFHVVLFIMLYRVGLTSESVDKNTVRGHSNESYWAVLSCSTVYYAVQGGFNFWVSGWNPVSDHSNESYWAVLSCGTVYYGVQGGSNFWVSAWSRSV